MTKSKRDYAATSARGNRAGSAGEIGNADPMERIAQLEREVAALRRIVDEFVQLSGTIATNYFGAQFKGSFESCIRDAVREAETIRTGNSAPRKHSQTATEQ